MTPFIAPVDDILFSLNNIAGASELPSWDDELAKEIIKHFALFAEDQIAPLDELGDRQGCRFENGQVRMPDGFVEAYKELAYSGWQSLTAPEVLGGMGQGPLVAAAISEIFSGANHSMQMICNLVPGAISTLLRFGTNAQQQEWIPRLAEGQTLSTMCLTEPNAGSDLSRIRTKAERLKGKWLLTGEKIFISGGDQDMSQDILHFVLARTGEYQTGTKGLSLFLCSKTEAQKTIRISRIEEKLGLHASPTCHMIFDGAPAQLIGEEGAGLKAMFTVMNHARIDVALQGVAHAARAHAISLAYAIDRQQGRKSDGADAALCDHADVRRMLDDQRCMALGARAMAHITLVELEKALRPELVDFLTPICKFFCTEAGIKSADLGIQILGGYGYLTEYRISQTWRDARITSIYEGANGIHYLTLATRGLNAHEGRGADAFDELIMDLSHDDRVTRQLEEWRKHRTVVSKAIDPTELAHDFAQKTAHLFLCAVWSKIAHVSDDQQMARLCSRLLSRQAYLI